jgi:hypothetical protein
MEFKSFLSHKYKNPDVNLYFFDIFSQKTEVQFEIDAGSTPTCVTRLERMITRSDAFIGIYPFSDDISVAPSENDLLNASKYFRLECDIAFRAQVPSLVLYDQRYGGLFKLPAHVRQEAFDYQEVVGAGGSPTRRRFEKLFEIFQSEVNAAIELNSISDVRYSKKNVAILVPHSISSKHAYTEHELGIIETALRKNGFGSVAKIPWPPVFDGNLFSAVETADFAIVDIGNESMETGLIGYLHGKCIPCVRLMKGYSDKNIVNKRTNLRGIYGVIPVGYPKDIIFWKNTDALAYELSLRLEFIRSPVKRINTKNEAFKYFQKAKQRNETIFLSYSGNDSQLASLISAELKKRFQRVFDYKDGESITPGEPWIKKIFDKLSGSKLGIPLVTSSYLESGNCAHEAQEMIALRDSNKISVIPLKLYEEKIETPTWMRNRQYMHYYDYPDVKSLVDMIVKFYDEQKKELTNGST